MSVAYVVLTTTSSKNEARKISRALVRERLAACVSVIPHIQLTYRWQGRVETAGEWLLIIKTLPGRFRELKDRIRTLHSYTVPEILALPVPAGGAAYLAWLRASVSAGRSKAP